MLDPVEFHRALADETRLRCLMLMAAEGELCVCEMTHALDMIQPKVSRHLANLRAAGLVADRKRGQWVFYSIRDDLPDWARAVLKETLRGSASRDPMRGDAQKLAAMRDRPGLCLGDDKGEPMIERPFNVLFLCTGNSARSIMAEVLTRQWGGGRFNAFSAGSHPAGEIHPLTFGLLQSLNLPVEGLHSKGWDEFAASGAPKLDFVFTVCDAAAGEECPTWPGQPVVAHWGVADPVARSGSEVERVQAFREAFRQLENRIKIFTSLRFDSLSKLALRQRLDEIGKTILVDQ